jgi:hypothetical protein
MNKFSYVNQLEEKEQEKIIDEIQLHLYQNEGFAIDSAESKEAVDNALNSRLVDLENIVKIIEYQ